jgi:uncharacterized membrane protein YphA (DoxX/SURF4 family)
MSKCFVLIVLLLGIALLYPNTISAHEVYVLHPSDIQKDLTVSDINVLAALNSMTNLLWLVFFATIAVISLSVSFVFSFSKWGLAMTTKVEKFRDLAFPLIRIVFGISLISSATHASLFGPELPLSQLMGADLWKMVLLVCGIFVTVGLFTRICALILLALFTVSIISFQEYMLTYINYLGEMVVLLLAGGERFSIDHLLFKKFTFLSSFGTEKITIPILRITFALSIIYAAVYVKFLHPSLSYNVVTQYQLTQFFPFDPLFVVLGAGLVELVIGLLFLIGLNMRWNIFFFTFWATLSLLFFGEAVWPHYILFGIAIGLFLYGYDRYTLENKIVNLTKRILR